MTTRLLISNKNDRVNWDIFKQNKAFDKAKNKKDKKAKKRKGKGKNRMETDEEAKEREQKKIEKARRKRMEREGEGEDDNEEENKEEEKEDLFNKITDMDVDDDFDEDDDDEMEACNAPSTRKANSQPILDTKSPFHGDSLFSFTEMAPKDDSKVISPKINLEIPTKSSQLELDLKSLKSSVADQREYLKRIDPNSLASIFKSSIEVDTVLSIFKAFNSATKKWIKDNTVFLVNFVHKLTKVDRFGMAIEFLSDNEKSEVYEFTTKLENSASLMLDLDDESPNNSEGLEARIKVIQQVFE